MLWQHTYPARVADRQQALRAEADARRLARAATPSTPHYREWLARRLVLLALRLAPSLRGSPRGPLAEEPSMAGYGVAGRR